MDTGIFQSKSSGSVANVNNSATIQIESSTLSVGSFLQTAGTTQIATGAILANSATFTLNGGSLQGGGNITGTVQQNSGVIYPGGLYSIGKLYIQHWLLSNGTIQIDCSSQSLYDQLIAGDVNFANGSISLVFINGFLPSNDTVLSSVIQGTITGNSR